MADEGEAMIRILTPSGVPSYQIQGVRERLKDLTRGLNRINVPTVAYSDPELTRETSLAVVDASSIKR